MNVLNMSNAFSSTLCDKKVAHSGLVRVTIRCGFDCKVTEWYLLSIKVFRTGSDHTKQSVRAGDGRVTNDRGIVICLPIVKSNID